jgi:hypothetical protein
MSATNYDDLRRHIGHKIVCVCYGKEGEDPDNVAVECEDCNEVLLDYDNGPGEGTTLGTYFVCGFGDAPQEIHFTWKDAEATKMEYIDIFGADGKRLSSWKYDYESNMYIFIE